jgi:creatinine amidohydrolase
LVKLTDISWIVADEFLENIDTILVPVGSTEQHGPHAPLGTDTYTADFVANIIAEKSKILVLPTIPIGVSDHHRQFTGTLWVPSRLFHDYMVAVILSAASHGWRKFLIVNGHGGNTPSLREVCEELRRRHGIFAAVVNAYPPKMDGHAGRDETSIMLHIHPDLVYMNHAPETTQHGDIAGIPMKAQKIDPAEFGYDTIDLSATGVFGAAGKTIKATEATPEHGKKILEEYIAEIIELVEKIKKAKLVELLPKPHV